MIVVTGGVGFIGSVLIARLNELGEKDILAVDQKAKGSPKWDNLRKHQFEEYLESDDFIARLESTGQSTAPPDVPRARACGLEKKEFDGKIKAIFHMGACSDTTQNDRDFLRKNNSGYSERIANWAIQNKVYLCYAASAAAYGDGSLGFSDDDALTPRLKPLNPYGQSKLDFDLWVLKNGYEKSVTGFRFFNVYGPNEYHKGHMRSMIHKGFEQIRENGKIRLFKSYKKEYADGGQKRDFVYVKDAVDAMIWFFQNQKCKGIYNLGTGKAQSWNELAQSLFKACGKPKNIEYIEMPETLKNQYQYFTQADMRKFEKTGCPVKFKNLEEGAKDYVQNYLLKQEPHL